MKRVLPSWALALVVLTGGGPAHAITPIRAISYTSDSTLLLGGQPLYPFLGGRETMSTGLLAIPAPIGPVTGTTPRLTTLGSVAFGWPAFALEGTMDTSPILRPGDAFVWEANAEYKRLLWDDAILPGVLVDAVSADPSGVNVLLSFDTSVELEEIGGSTFFAHKEDLVLVNAFSQAEMFFDGSAHGVPRGIDLDGAHATSSGKLFLSFDGSGSIEGTHFERNDVIEYDMENDSYHLAYEGAAMHDGWRSANLIGLRVEVANLQVGGGRMVGRPGGSSCLSPVLRNDGASVWSMSVKLMLPAGEITEIGNCSARSELFVGIPQSSLIVGSEASAGVRSPAVALLEGENVSCRVRLGAGLTTGSRILAATGTATNHHLEAYDPITATPATLVISTCAGDCDGNGNVDIGEVQRAVNASLGRALCDANATSTNCPIIDADGNGSVSLGELQQAVNSFLANCPTDSSAKRVFITSTQHTGNLGGLAGADGICALRATNAGLGGTYKAWLSTDTVSASARLTHANNPYTLVDGTLVADGWTDLTDGTLQHDIDRSELGTTTSGGFWTATTESGAAIAGSNCTGWTSTGNSGTAGSGVAQPGWSSDSTVACSSARPLLCIQQ